MDEEEPTEASLVQRECLVLILGETLTILIQQTWPVSLLRHAGREYADTGHGEVTGFYDWLRNANGDLLGVRYTPFESTEFVLEALAAKEYVRVVPRKFIEIYFGGAKHPDERRSNDQAFLYAALLSGGDETLALALGTEELTSADLNRLPGSAPRSAADQ